MVNSWDHLLYFGVVFLIVPALIFISIALLFKHPFLLKWKKYVLPFLSLFTFFYLLKICLFIDPERKIIVLIGLLAICFAYFLHAHIKKVVVIQWILILLGLFNLSGVVVKQLNYSKSWTNPPDDIEKVVFDKTPNVYYIQPDGYVNFSELRKGFYQIDNRKFETFLQEEGFKNYPNFRSNYSTTLASNGSMFMMKHHYHNGNFKSNEVQFAREIIISKNTVLDVFKNNNYKTYFISEIPYLLLNRPTMGYDFCNIDYDDFKYIREGVGEPQSIFDDLEYMLAENIERPKFSFIQILKPWHIHSKKISSFGADREKEIWKKNLEMANETLTKMIQSINEEDPKGIVIIGSDHGGYVGMEYTHMAERKSLDPNFINSIFSSQLSVKWPEGMAPEMDAKIKTSVNLFRILFSYLSNDSSYLNNLEEDDSFLIINQGAPNGVYQCIDSEGEITFKVHNEAK